MSNKARRPVPARKPTLQPWHLIAGAVVLGVIAIAAILFSNSGGPKVEVTVQGAPSLAVDRDKVDLGDVKLGQTVSVEFVVANIGDQPLRFSEPPYIEVVEGC